MTNSEPLPRNYLIARPITSPELNSTFIEPVAPDDLFITDELPRRSPKNTDYFQEKLALQDLAAQMGDHPADVLPRLVDLAIELTGSITGGISLYEESPAPGIFRWHYLRGYLSKFEGGTTPRNFSPCGITLDKNTPVLVRRPERFYSWLADQGISLPECLLVPIYIGGTLPLGTLWLVSENEGHFDSGHARVMTELASFAGLAVRMLRTEERLEKALEEQEMLTREMSHRVKNLLAITSSIVRMSGKAATSPQEMTKTALARLDALARSQSLVRSIQGPRGESVGASTLDALVKTILRPYDDPEERGVTRLSLDGPEVRISERPLTTLALVLHELATNAVKYGALSAKEGSVSVSWRIVGKNLLLSWREHNGPRVGGVPKAEGFGSLLAERSIVGQLGGTFTRDWRPEGLIASLSLPMERLDSDR